MMFSGTDLHSNNGVVAIIDDADRVLGQKRLPNDISKITGFLAQWQDEFTGVVVESTYNWYWLVDGLQDCRTLASTYISSTRPRSSNLAD
jgi:transposase